MINKLRHRVIIYTVIAVALVLFILMGIVNVANFYNKDKAADEILSLLAENDGAFPMMGGPWERKDDGPKGEPPGNQFPFPGMTQETPYETRFFTVFLGDDGLVKTIDTGKIAAISSSDAGEMVAKAEAKGKTTGYDGNYKYLCKETEVGKVYVFLDCTRDLESVKSFLKNSLLVSLMGLITIGLLVVLLSPKMIRPIVESYEKQKEFITNAGHELKTPMAVIKSCTDVIEMENGASKWTSGIHEQVEKLTNLTNQMVELSKMDEGPGDLPMENVDLSSLMEETLEGFELTVEQQGWEIEKNIEPNIVVRGNRPLLAELVSILADNALKYGNPDEPIKFRLLREGKKVILREENGAEGLNPGSQEKLFDRFYRGDTSHSSEKEGSGIGLSMARSIVTAHGGTITAESPDGQRFIITATL